MKKIIFLMLWTGLCWLWPAGRLPAWSATDLTLIYVSNMPEIEPVKDKGGLPELGSLVKRLRDTTGNILFLHGGDSLAPSALSSFDRGIHMIDILNSLEPDVMAINTREFAYKEDELILRVHEAAFPMLNVNIFDPLTGGNLEGVESYQCFDIDGYQVCVFAVVDPEVLTNYLPKRIQLRDTPAMIRKTAMDLRKKGADLIILMTGFELPDTEKWIAEKMIDLIIRADSQEDGIYPMSNGLYAKQGADNGKALRIDLSLEGKPGACKWRYSADLLTLGNFAPDPEIENKVQHYLASLAQIMDVVVGVTQAPLDTTREAVRTGENAFGNLVADAVRKFYDADLALVNGGGIRGNRIYAAGSRLSRRDIQSELPFRNSNVLIRITGRQIIQALENGFSKIEDVKGRFPHVAGMKVAFCPAAAVGKRVKKVMVGDTPLDPDALYSLATLNFLADGGDGYDVFAACERVSTNKATQLIWETVRAYVEEHQRISPKIEGRLVQMCD